MERSETDSDVGLMDAMLTTLELPANEVNAELQRMGVDTASAGELVETLQNQ